MKEPSIQLSKKHGLNPSLGVCFVCGEDDGTVVLPGQLKGDAEAPRRAVWTREPCPTCKGWMAKGIVFLSVREGEHGENPYRTGKLAVLKEEAVSHMISNKTLLASILKKRICFMDDRSWIQLGLPLGSEKGDAHGNRGMD